jgi:hypothetical protein
MAVKRYILCKDSFRKNFLFEKCTTQTAVLFVVKRSIFYAESVQHWQNNCVSVTFWKIFSGKVKRVFRNENIVWTFFVIFYSAYFFFPFSPIILFVLSFLFFTFLFYKCLCVFFNLFPPFRHGSKGFVCFLYPPLSRSIFWTPPLSGRAVPYSSTLGWNWTLSRPNP